MSTPALPLYGPTAPSSDLSPATGAQVADRVLDGLGDGLRTLAGPLLPQLVAAYTAALQPTVDALQPPPGPAAAAALAAGTTGGSDGPPIPAIVDLLRTAHPEYLAQLAGVVVPVGATADQVRQLVLTRSTARRGTAGAILAAVRAVLTGTKVARITERDGSPWQFTVTTYSAQTPSAAAVLAAIAPEKPLGLVARVVVQPGQTFGDLKASGQTFGQVKTQTCQQVRTTVPAA